ncbi:MAG: pentapeptide repeat-containing protein [Pseudonocardiaceae bacterium]
MKEGRDGWWLVITMLLAVALFGTVIALLLSLDRTTSVSESIRTGGLVSAAVVALYALWLNDRRRRVEESRHDLERRSNEQAWERAADERFARAVELLGHEADQVRVGAVHALAGLARSRSSYVQTVLDVICSYLRRPFDHPDYVQNRTGERPPWETADERDADRERQVRLAAQRVISELLLDRPREGGQLPDLDLTGALLYYIDLSGKAIGQLVLRDVQLHGTTRLNATEIDGEAWFTRAVSYGRLECDNVVFRGRSNFPHLIAHDRVSFEGAHFQQGAVFLSSEFYGPVTLAGSAFDKSVDLRRTVFRSDLDLRCQLPNPVRPGTGGMTVCPGRDVRLPDGWVMHNDGRIGRNGAPEIQL